MAAQVTTDSKFAATVVRGLVDHGPFGPSGTDLSLELALSVWLRWHTKNLLEARSALIVMRTELLRMGHLATHAEPIPLLGSSARNDVVTLAHQVNRLLHQSAAAAPCDVDVIVRRLIDQLERRSEYSEETAAGN